MPPLAIVVEEEEILVLDYRAADCAAKLVDMVRLSGDAARVIDPGIGIHLPVAEIFKCGAVKLVGAGLGHDVGDRAAGASELGRVAAAVDLKLLHRIHAELVRSAAGAGASDGLAIKIVVVVSAIDLHAVERPAEAAET